MKLCQLIYPPPSPHLMGGGGVQTSTYTSGTINGQGYALIFPQTVYITANSNGGPGNQDQTNTINVTIDGIYASYIGYRIFQGVAGTSSGTHSWSGFSQNGPETFMFTTSFSAGGNFQKIIIYLYT